jgi:hypothetical protein
LSKLDAPDFSTFDAEAVHAWLLAADAHTYRDGREGFLRRSSQLKLNMAAAAKRDTARFKAPPAPVDGAPAPPPPPPGIGEMSLKTYCEQREALTGIAPPRPRGKPPVCPDMSGRAFARYGATGRGKRDRERERLAAKLRYALHRSARCEAARIRYHLNREEICARRRAWYAENAEAERERARRYRERKETLNRTEHEVIRGVFIALDGAMFAGTDFEDVAKIRRTVERCRNRLKELLMRSKQENEPDEEVRR